MSLCLSQIAGIAVLVPALQFGQVPDILEIRDATKDAFQATSKALDSIESKRAKGKPAAGKNGKSASPRSSKSDNSGGTIFSKLGERAERAEAARAQQQSIVPSEQEKRILSFLGSSSGWLFQGMLGFVGVAVTWCIGVRIKERVKDHTTGRVSLSKCRIVKR